MTNMVERVARAIMMVNGFDMTPEEADNSWWAWRSDAEAAIKAMREPTDEMMEAANNVELAPWSSGWQAMIDAALISKIEE